MIPLTRGRLNQAFHLHESVSFLEVRLSAQTCPGHPGGLWEGAWSQRVCGWEWLRLRRAGSSPLSPEPLRFLRRIHSGLWTCGGLLGLGDKGSWFSCWGERVGVQGMRRSCWGPDWLLPLGPWGHHLRAFLAVSVVGGCSETRPLSAWSTQTHAARAPSWAPGGHRSGLRCGLLVTGGTRPAPQPARALDLEPSVYMLCKYVHICT